ncbi:MAG TPA: glycosyltransferase, partial [Archangium sp.]
MSDLPRLLLCCFDVVPAPTAISRRLTEYLKGLSDRYQVVVLSVKTPDHTHIERYQGARLLRVPVGSGDLAARVQAFDRAVRRQLDSEEYVMVHFFDPFGGYALCERRAEFGFKLIYDACSLPSVDLPFLYGEEEANRRFIAKVRRQELYCLMNADVVVVANDVTRDFVTGLGVSREQVQVLPAPVDLGPYDPKVMGPPTSEPMRLIHLGNQSSAQDLGVVLEALKLAQATAEVHLTIVGPKHDEHQARLEEQVGALGLTGKVEFQPPVAHDDLHKVLAAADVGLLTLADVERNSRVGSPLSRLGEYLAAGRPVIAADVASARALLPDDGVVLYRPGEVQSLVDAITSLATEPTRRAKLGTAARAAALERDGLKVRADLVAIYVNLSGTGVRAVGDADATTPDEPTQLGRSSLDSEDTQRRKAERARTDPPSGTNKVKTDPAIAAADETSPEAAMGERPPVMGVPLREDEPPVVVGQEVRDLAAELAQVTTEPNAQRFTDPPVVMGMPLASATTPKTGPHLSLVPKEDDAPEQKASPAPEDGPQEKTPSPHAPAVLDELGPTGGPDEPLQAGAPI